MKLHKKILLLAGVSCMLAGTNLLAEEKSAGDIINKVYQYMGGMDKLAFTAVMTEKVGDPEKEYRHELSVKLDRPGKLSMITSGDVKNRAKYLNDGVFTMMDNDLGFYAQIETPKTINGALDMIFDDYGVKAPLSHFMYDDMDKRTKPKDGKYHGMVIVDGTECDYISFLHEKKEVHVWVVAGDKPLVKTFSIIDRGAEEHPRINNSLTWHSNSTIKDKDFVFVAPKDAAVINIRSTKQGDKK